MRQQELAKSRHIFRQAPGDEVETDNGQARPLMCDERTFVADRVIAIHTAKGKEASAALWL